jgi:eukaryotic-like serine/threonine-protein kinase
MGMDLSGSAALVGSVVADRYRIESLLGEGAMGSVYRAEHVHMQKAVALKVLHQWMSQNPEVVRRFEREAVAAARVEHPNVAGATDFGRLADGSFYLVLEFIDGKSLAQLMEETGPMPAGRACRIAAQIAAALGAAHAAGIVHRDLKPENVMMPQSDVELGDVIKVLDFGMAKVQQADNSETKLTMHGAIYGTPQYMAPEQAAGQEVDLRADLYAFGVMLYEMLAGRPPFLGETMMALLVKHMTEKPPALPSSVPRPISQLVMRCLQTAPEDRPQSAQEILDQLAEFLADPLQGLGRASAFGLTRDAAGSVVNLPGSRGRPVWATRLYLLREGVGRAVFLVRDFLRKPLRVGAHSVPRWVPASAGLGFLLVGAALLIGRGEGSSQANAASRAPHDASDKSDTVAKPKADPHPPDADLAKVIQSAAMGSESALYALEQRDDDDRSITEWVGLTKARLMNKKVESGLVAFKAAIEMDESMSEDKIILGALRRLADQDEFASPIVEFAATDLGSTGADMLFHIWSKTSLKTTATTLAFEKLSSAAVQEHFSPALKVAMQLREAESCADYQKMLPEIERFGDDRTLTKLRPLLKHRGCGPAERDDCYPCLRKDKALDSAVNAAAMRKSPQFELRDFRFKK